MKRLKMVSPKPKPRQLTFADVPEGHVFLPALRTAPWLRVEERATCNAVNLSDFHTGLWSNNAPVHWIDPHPLQLIVEDTDE